MAHNAKTSSKRGPTGGRSSLPAFSRAGSSSATGAQQGSSQASRTQRSKVDLLWGKAPKWRGGQTGLTDLFSEQKRLRSRICAQAKLASLAESEVRSTEVERLRVVNQAILDNSPKVVGVENPFLHRSLTMAQTSSEEMIRRQGVNSFNQVVSRVGVHSKPSARSLRSRRHGVHSVTDIRVHNRPVDWFNLQGPLARYYRRDVERGYKGKPESWIRGPRAACLRDKLTRKNFVLPPLCDWDCHNPRSPLRWALNRCSVQSQVYATHGFSGERIIARPTNVVELRRQAASVQRLKLSDWPDSLESGQSWPTYPTLGESWTMARRGKFPIHHGIDPVEKGFLSRTRRPTRQIKPGVLARTISNLVVGHRADIKVPRKLLVYFRYRWGFLILRRCHINVLPRELVAHLSMVWKKDFSGMFLRYPVRLSEALRRLPDIEYYSMSGFVPASLGLVSSTTKRQRPGRNERLQRKLEKHLPHTTYEEGASSSDKSDDGVRLC